MQVGGVFLFVWQHRRASLEVAGRLDDYIGINGGGEHADRWAFDPRIASTISSTNLQSKAHYVAK
jgi:hypothetical protein